MKTICLSSSTSEATGVLNHRVLYQNQPLIADTPDYELAASYARTVYHQLDGSKQMTHWDGDRGVESLVESRK